MIYISSACSSRKKIGESVKEIAEIGFTNIELTGGTHYYDDYQIELLQLQDQYSLNYLVHNYFPPPKNHFVLNLASLNDEIYERSLEHCQNAIALSKKLGSKKIGFHAGFLIDIRVQEIGQKISKDKLFDKNQAINRFCRAFNILKELADDDIELYIENNVFSQTNARTYNGQNPFMLTDYDSYLEFRDRLEFKLLLDIAHLKVSVNSLKLDFAEQFGNLFNHTNYIHISENDGFHDQNRGFNQESKTLEELNAYDFRGKTITLEIYHKLESIQQDYELVKKVLKLES